MESTKWLYWIIGIIILVAAAIIIRKYKLITKMKRVNCVDLDKLEEKKFSGMGKLYIKALGGEKNIVSVDPCMTRIRVIMKDGSLLDEKRIIVLGAHKVIKLTDTKIHIIIGLKAEKLAEEINDIREKNR
ncbi:PTS transporter subunit EIIB [Fusobacterium ulcerans]|jgi:PTS system N-acetylglucosamine-specific IIB component|uniref:PTS transporter subunit EIIB n=1 Tax=Fusobacterium ulcerans TaxID=861 RepID=UPI001D0BC3BF|nr:PTS transporter subunit EIIB [Fusobacterium ulcerans]MCB8565936.1 PTS transporter subunit EIIB [Fusobacterium ulcerans]MCB8647981.1 PTS transporter subunit EIIB [Fusobacterium ulcerans]